MYQNNYRGSVKTPPLATPTSVNHCYLLGQKKVFTGLVQLLVWDTNVAAVSFSWDTKNSRRKVKWKQSIHVIDVNFGASFIPPSSFNNLIEYPVIPVVFCSRIYERLNFKNAFDKRRPETP